MTSSKAERREARKQKKQEDSQRLAERLGLTDGLKEVVIPDLPECPKVPLTPEAREEALKKVPILNTNPSTFQTKMTWCVSVSDLEGHWSWSEARLWSEEEWSAEIFRELGSLSSLTWAEIAGQHTGTGKKRRKRHHQQAVNTIVEEAKDRWRYLDLEQFDVAYRFRLGGTKRVWGIQCGSHFYLIWFERLHKIYPVGK